MDIFQSERNQLECENWAMALGRIPLGGPRGSGTDDDEEDDDDDLDLEDE